MYPLPDTVDGGNIVRDKNGSPTGKDTHEVCSYSQDPC